MDNSNSVDKFLRNLGMSEEKDNNQIKADVWDKIIKPASSYLILGDVDTGKSGLAYWLLERFSQKYGLLPAVVGFPQEKAQLLPEGFTILSAPSECVGLEDAIVFIDEADLQIPLEDTKARKYVVNFLSLPQHRNQIFLLAFHFPRLALGRYLPFFSAFLLKRPPYLLEFAGKRQGDVLTKMMAKAEERFSELPLDEEVVRHTYVVAPKLRWQGMVENPLPSFWSMELRRAWSGVGLRDINLQKQLRLYSVNAKTISDEEYVQALRNQSKIQKGEDLICVVCNKKANSLISDVCEECFWHWALSTKKEQ